METLHDFIERISREAGRLSLQYREQGSLLIENKDSNRKDIVTAADKAIESYLRKEILGAYPDHSIMGEEGDDVKGNECLWVLDPIDGTVSFAHGLPIFTVSIGYMEGDRIVAGAITAPVLNEFFYAERGRGGVPERPSDPRLLLFGDGRGGHGHRVCLPPRQLERE